MVYPRAHRKTHNQIRHLPRVASLSGVWTLVCWNFSPRAFLQGSLWENLPKPAVALRTPVYHLIPPLHPHSNVKRSIRSSSFDQLDN